MAVAAAGYRAAKDAVIGSEAPGLLFYGVSALLVVPRPKILAFGPLGRARPGASSTPAATP